MTYKQLKIKNKQMKKVLAIFAIAALAACGGATTEVKTDSTAVVSDSTTAVVDSTKTDSVEVK